MTEPAHDGGSLNGMNCIDFPLTNGNLRECERMRASISAALDGELSEPESIRVRDHLAHCPSCRAFQADTKRFVSTLRAVPLEPVSSRDEQTHELRLSFDELALVYKSLQAAKTLGALPPQDELLNDTIELVDQALNKAV